MTDTQLPPPPPPSGFAVWWGNNWGKTLLVVFAVALVTLALGARIISDDRPDPAPPAESPADYGMTDEQFLQIVWDNLQPRSLQNDICDGLDLFGADLTYELFAQTGPSFIDQPTLINFLEEECP